MVARTPMIRRDLQGIVAHRLGQRSREVRGPAVSAQQLAEVPAPRSCVAGRRSRLEPIHGQACVVLGTAIVAGPQVEWIGEPPDPRIERRSLGARYSLVVA